MQKRAILVGAGEDREMGELSRLAGTLGLEVVGSLEQGRRDAVGYLGRGKRGELAKLIGLLRAEVLVADDELSASQSRVLEKDAGVPVVDRTALIIRIFEAHAKDAVSRLEVELAELTYRLPRVRGGYTALSRLGGGGATTRGPGEQQLEYDRRAIRERMERIRKRLREEKYARETRGARLKKGGPPSVALVGYTNAGKTTILNALSREKRSTADRLFETLETTTRLVTGTTGNVEGGARPDFVLTDTVGVIRKLPTELVHSFAGTLEVAQDADILVVCADASSEKLEEEIRTVEDVLREIFSGNGVIGRGQDTILCLNKSDLLSEERRRELASLFPGGLLISAKLDASPLLDAIYKALVDSWVRMQILIPHAEYGAVSDLYGRVEIHARENTAEGLHLDITLPEVQARRYANYRTA